MSDPNQMTPPETPEAANGTTAQAHADGADPAADLRARVEAAEKEKAEYLDLLQRTRAEFENYQKRVQRDLAQERRYAQVPLARDLLPVLDNLDRAVAAAREAKESGPWVEGLLMVQTMFLDALRRHHIRPIDALGKPFDPNRHQAVMQEPTAEQPPNTVVKVYEQGFVLHDRVLRPAQVVVSRAPDGPAT